MASLGALGIGLSVVFVGFVLALVAELCYLIFWKKRGLNLARVPRIHETALLRQQDEETDSDFDVTDVRRESSRVNVIANRHQSYRTSTTKLIQSDDSNGGSHYLMGPPRFLFTIREETKEELESECLRSRTGSMDFSVQIQQQFSEPTTPCETPFTTPPSSPSIFTTPPATPTHRLNLTSIAASGASSGSSPCSSSSSSSMPGMRALAREPPLHCTVLIPAGGAMGTQQRNPRYYNSGSNSRKTTMMMLLLNPTPTSPPVMSPAASPTAAAYSTPPTHLYSPRLI